MKKMETAFRYNNCDYTLQFKNSNVKCYLNDSDNSAVITDKEDNVLFEITADCAQNTGFLHIKSEE